MNFSCLFLFLITIISAEEFDLNDGHVMFKPPSLLAQVSETNDDNVSKDKSSTQKLNFEKPYYIINDEKQKLTKGYKPPFNVQLNRELMVKGDFKLTDVQKFGMEEYFAVSLTDKVKVSVDVKSDIPVENIKNKNQLIFLLEFVQENKDDTICTMLIMFLQDKPPEKPEKIIFEKSTYKINSFSEYTGVIGEFVAKLDKNDAKSVIKYSLESNNDILKNSLKLNELTGVLEIIKILTPDTYNFKISAKIDSGIETKADVTLIINHIAVCDSKNSKFRYSQLIKRMPEDQTGEILSPSTPVDKCVYKIVYQEPAGDYFKLDEKTGALQMVKGIKRDDAAFKNSVHPKFTIKLGVSCESAENVERNNGQNSNAGDSNILYDPVQMVLVVAIDKAANTPIFNTDKIVVGYPRKYDIITQYGPPLVISVVPFVGDRDTSSVRYSIVEGNSAFSIDPILGNVYPLSYVNNDEEYSFTVLAKDIVGMKDGKSVSKEGKLVISVKLLTISQIVEIYFIGEPWQEVDELLQDYTSNLDVEIKSLIHAVIPVTNEQRQSNKVLNDKKQIHLLRALCYALDKKQHSVVKGEIIVDQLKTSPSVFSIQTLESRKTPESKGHSGSSSFIVTTSIFSVILALGVIVTIFYVIYIRRKNIPVIIMRRSGNNRNSVTALEDDMEAPSQTRWIDPEQNIYSRFDRINTEAFSNPTFQRAQRVSYSDTRGAGEVIIMENTNNIPTSGVSSFKPNSANENFPSQNITENVYRDLELPSFDVATSSTSKNIPVLDVTPLPPLSEQQWRKRTNIDDK